MNDENKSGSWWTTLPGILSGLAGLIIAVTGLYVALHRPPPTPEGQTATNAPAEVQGHWYGFTNAANIDRDTELRISCTGNKDFERIRVSSGTSFSALCGALSKRCVKVCDFQEPLKIATKRRPNLTAQDSLFANSAVGIVSVPELPVGNR